MDEMNKILDQIMKLNHEVSGYYIKMAEMEILRKPEDKLLQIAVNTKMESIRKLYLQLGAEMQESGMERTRNWYENFNIAVKQEPNKVEDNIISKLQSKLVEIFLNCGKVVMCGMSELFRKKVGFTKDQLFYVSHDIEAFEYLRM